jgi:hypothetical protein
MSSSLRSEERAAHFTGLAALAEVLPTTRDPAGYRLRRAPDPPATRLRR